MKPTHIVYNPEGKPDGLYYIPEMPEKPKPCSIQSHACRHQIFEGIGCECTFEQKGYEVLVQSAIASAIKVDDRDMQKVKRLIFDIHSASDIPCNVTEKFLNEWIEERVGKVYELSGIELEVYVDCKHILCSGECIECTGMIQLARIKEYKQDVCNKCDGKGYIQVGNKITSTTPCECQSVIKYKLAEPKQDVFDTGARLPKQCEHIYSRSIDEPRPRKCKKCGHIEDSEIEPKQEEQPINAKNKLIKDFLNKVYGERASVNDVVTDLQIWFMEYLENYSISIEPKENQEHIWKEAIFDISRFATRDETIIHLKSKFLITRK